MEFIDVYKRQSLLCVILGYFISLYYGTIGMFIGTAISLFIGQVLMINRYYALSLIHI